LKSSDTFPGHSMVVGPSLAAVPGCGVFDSSVGSPGTDREE
jgi:hypothetical protein